MNNISLYRRFYVYYSLKQPRNLRFVYLLFCYSALLCGIVILCKCYGIMRICDIFFKFPITISIFRHCFTNRISFIVISERQKDKKVLICQHPLIICIAEIYSKLKLIRLEFAVADKRIYIIHLCVKIVFQLGINF